MHAASGHAVRHLPAAIGDAPPPPAETRDAEGAVLHALEINLRMGAEGGAFAHYRVARRQVAGSAERFPLCRARLVEGSARGLALDPVLDWLWTTGDEHGFNGIIGVAATGEAADFFNFRDVQGDVHGLSFDGEAVYVVFGLTAGITSYRVVREDRDGAPGVFPQLPPLHEFELPSEFPQSPLRTGIALLPESGTSS